MALVEAGELSQVISQATAPAFVLGAVAGFVAVLLNRITILIERIRSLNEIADDDDARSHLKSDIPRLRRRVELLNNATYLALLSALCTASLVVVAFASALFRLAVCIRCRPAVRVGAHSAERIELSDLARK